LEVVIPAIRHSERGAVLVQTVTTKTVKSKNPLPNRAERWQGMPVIWAFLADSDFDLPRLSARLHDFTI
jgi:hypothetical protein